MEELRISQDPPPEPQPQGNDDPFQSAVDQVLECCEHVRHLFTAKVDLARLRLRTLFFHAVGSVAFVVAAVSVGAAAAVFVLYGVILALARLCGDRLWLGYLVGGALGVAASYILIMIAWSRLKTAWRTEIIRKYERRKKQQRVRFGRDVRAAARNAG